MAFSTTETVVLFTKAILNIPVHPDQAILDDLERPFITYSNSAGQTISYIGGDSNTRDETFTFTIHADTYEETANIRDLMIESYAAADLLGFDSNSDVDGTGNDGEFTKQISFTGTFQAGVDVNLYVMSSSFAEKAATASYVEVAIGAAEWNTIHNKPSGIVSGSSQIDFNDIQNKPTISATASYALSAETAKTSSYALNVPPFPSGMVTSSAQIDYTGIQNKPNVIASASYIEYNNVYNKPSLVSSSAQIPLVSSSSHADYAETSKNAATASYVNANIAIVGFISSSILAVEMITGSTKFGDSSDDTHEFTGSVKITGSLEATASWTNAVMYNNIQNKPTLVSGSQQIDFNDIQNKPTLIASSSVSDYAKTATSSSFATTASTASYLAGGIPPGTSSYYSGSGYIIDTTPKSYIAVTNGYIASQSYDLKVASFFDTECTGGLSITASNIEAGRTAIVRIFLSGSLTGSAPLSVPSNWTYIGGTIPKIIPMGRYSIISLTCFGNREQDVVAGFSYQP